jgi:hypothetical protein
VPENKALGAAFVVKEGMRGWGWQNIRPTKLKSFKITSLLSSSS